MLPINRSLSTILIFTLVFESHQVPVKPEDRGKKSKLDTNAGKPGHSRKNHSENVPGTMIKKSEATVQSYFDEPSRRLHPATRQKRLESFAELPGIKKLDHTKTQPAEYEKQFREMRAANATSTMHSRATRLMVKHLRRRGADLDYVRMAQDSWNLHRGSREARNGRKVKKALDASSSNLPQHSSNPDSKQLKELDGHIESTTIEFNPHHSDHATSEGGTFDQLRQTEKTAGSNISVKLRDTSRTEGFKKNEIIERRESTKEGDEDKGKTQARRVQASLLVEGEMVPHQTHPSAASPPSSRHSPHSPRSPPKSPALSPLAHLDGSPWWEKHDWAQ